MRLKTKRVVNGTALVAPLAHSNISIQKKTMKICPGKRSGQRRDGYRHTQGDTPAWQCTRVHVYTGTPHCRVRDKTGDTNVNTSRRLLPCAVRD